MSTSILVGYATKYGSTQEVAETIAATLREGGLAVVCQPTKEWQDVRAQFDKELLKFPWFAPVAIEIFGGKFDPAKLRFPLNLLPALKQMPASDIRDWTAIRAWASDLAAKLAPSGA